MQDKNIPTEIKGANFLYYYILNRESYQFAIFNSPLIAKDIINKYHIKQNNQIDFLDYKILLDLKNDTLDNFLFSINTDGHPKYISDFLLYQYAPLAYIDGSLISKSSSIRFAHKSYGANLLKIHSIKSGILLDKINCISEYNNILNAQNIIIEPFYSYTFIQNPNIKEWSFKLPAFLLSLSLNPRQFYPEILGANLVMSVLDVPLFKSLLSTNIQHTPYFTFKENQLENIVNLSMVAIQDFLKDNIRLPDMKKRIYQGFMVTFNIIQEFYTKIKITLSDVNSFTAHSKLYSIIERIYKKAYGYHKKGKIGGKAIDEWFGSNEFNPEAFLYEFAKSKYITPGHPEKSSFLTYLTSENGPMFRVFPDEDLNIIKEWILTLPHNTTESDKASKMNDDRSVLASDIYQVIPIKYSSSYLSIREMYYNFLHIDDAPEMLAYAKKFVNKWLRDSKIKSRILTDYKIPFSIYSHAKLEKFIDDKHRFQINSYKPLGKKAPEKSKAEIILEAVSIAPMTFADGAWLKCFSDVDMMHSNITRKLYHTYNDELGNGDNNLHHGNIYRNLMKQMNIKLPEFDTTEFTHSEHFDDSSFFVPVFWFAISSFPKTFMAELLGLNLAMELSGIGGDYRRSSDILKYYSFNSRFTELHNTIDNFYNGHTTWAMEAICLYLDEILQKSDIDTVNHHWKRIWNGYISLSPAPKYIKFLSTFL